ncbi:hypothetical protein ACL03H_12780 [Saccharopolyspora sp. MS10]|uniref:hypothetical protein n=1 Tax=Saccharopolyspora sp. MS10 TaxID=3385973 RepID=UPI0039A362BF
MVREFMLRPERDGFPVNGPVAVLVFCGARGVGKTALLDALATELVRTVPHARLDCGRFRDRPVPQALAALAYQLAAPCPGYGSLRLHRSLTAQLALGPVPARHRSSARAHVAEQLDQYPKITDPRQFLAAIADDLVAAPGPAPGSALSDPHLPELLTGGVDALRRARRNRGDGRAWFGHQDRELGRDPVEVLAELNRTSRLGGSAAREVGEVLWAALLADLRDGFRPGRPAGQRALNCAVLLDDADLATGLATSLDAALGVVEPAPLTVVATTGTCGSEPVPIDRASYADHVERANRRHAPGTYLVRLGEPGG